MGEYFFYATVSPFLWAIVNVIDYYQLKRIYRSSSLAIIMTGFFLLIPLVFSYYKMQALTYPSTFLGVSAGILAVLSNWFYFKALREEETSIVVALWSLTPVGIYILSYLFLGEILSEKQSLGALIIILGSCVISFFGKKSFHFSKSFFFMVVASMLYAFNAVLAKLTFNNTEDFFSGFFSLTLGMIIATSMFFFSRRNLLDTYDVLKNKKKFTLLIVVSEMINILAIYFQDQALNIGSLTVVKVIEGLQPMLVLLDLMILSFFSSYFFESINHKTLIPKLLIMFGTLTGLWFIY